MIQKDCTPETGLRKSVLRAFFCRYYVKFFARCKSRLFLILPILLAGVGFGDFSPCLSAAERWRDFYSALLERGYEDTAIDYLESFRGRGDCPDDMAMELDFLVGKALLARARTGSASERDVFLKQSRELLTRFLAEHPDHPQAFDASAQLAMISIREGERELAKMKDDMSDVEKMKYREAARTTFDSARGALDKALELARTRVKEIQADPEKAKSEEAMAIYGEYLNLLLDSTELIAQTAETYPENSSSWTEGLTAAKEKFNEIYQKYQMYPGGYRARFEEAKIANRLGDADSAVEILNEISALPNQRALYVLKTEALELFGQITLRAKKPERLIELIRNFNGWKNVNVLPPNYYLSTEGLQIHLHIGQAALALYELRENDRKTFNAAGKAVFADGGDSSAKLMARLDKVAFEAFDFVYQQKSPLSLEAENFLKNPLFSEQTAKATSDKPVDFVEAQQRVNRSWADFVQANLAAAEALSADAQVDASKRKKEAQNQTEQNFRWAFALATRKTDPEALDALRLQWATLKLLADQNEDAEILTDFLLYRRPGFDGATKAAEIGLKAIRNLHRQARKRGAGADEMAQIDEQIARKTDYIIKRWGENMTGNMLPVVQEAVMVRMETAIAGGDREKARSFLDRIPNDSPQRAVADIQLGQTLWADYLEQSADRENPADPAKLAEELASANASLEQGLSKRLSATNGGASDDMTSVYAALSLAQIAMTEGRPADALKWLSHPNIGPMTIAEKQALRLAREDAAATDNASETDSAEGAADTGAADTETADSGMSDSFQLTALTLALRTLVALGDFERAEATMGKLETFVAKGQGSQQRLTGVYLQLGKQLEDQIRALRRAAAEDPAKAEELTSVSEGFENFLERISQRKEGNTYLTLRWVGDTFYSMGTGLVSDGTESEADGQKAKKYFERAGRTYHGILKRIDSEPEWAPNEGAKTLVTIRLAECLAQVGRYPQAMKFLVPLLTANENSLDLQFTAAELYESWGKLDKTYFVRAIQGGEPKENGKNLVWGWNRIITLLSRNIDKGDLYMTRFYDAVLSKMECRRLWIATLTTPADIKKQATGGVNELIRLRKVQPDLGGAETFKKLEEYLRNFQTAAGENPTGFGAAEPEVNEPSQK